YSGRTRVYRHGNRRAYSCRSRSMIDRLLLFLTRKLKRKHIGWDGELYMTRFYLGRLGKWNFYLHRFLRGDNDRRLHDHPWANSYSIILSGSYVEERLLGVDPYTGPKTKFVTRRWFNAIRGVD